MSAANKADHSPDVVEEQQVSDYPTESNNNNNNNNNNNGEEEERANRLPSNNNNNNDNENDSDAAEMTDEELKPRVNPDAPPPPPPPRDVLVGPWLVAAMLLTTLVFTAVSIGLPWYRKRQRAGASASGFEEHGDFYLWKTTTKLFDTPAARTVTTHPGSYCWPVRRRVRVMEAFSIVGAAFALVATALAVAHAAATRVAALRTATVVATALCFGALTILVSFNFNVFFWSFKDCGAGSSYHSQLYEPFVGFGLTVTAWVLSGLAGVLAANALVLPADARSVDKSVKVFTLLALLGMLFSVVSCPITHWFYKDGGTRRASDILLWRFRTSTFMWDVQLPNTHTTVWAGDIGCPALTRYLRAAESFSVIAIAFNALAGLLGLLLWKSLVGTRVPAVVAAYAGCVASLVCMALELAVYHRSWCGGLYAFAAQHYVLSAGFGLIAAAFCVMLAAAAAATVALVLTSKYFPALIPGKGVKDIAIEECQ